MKIILMGLILLSITSCKYGVTFSKLKNLSEDKVKVEQIYTQELSAENHKVLRGYFSGIKELVYEYKNNTRIQSYTHKKFNKYFSDSFCEDSLVSKEVYSELMRKCNVSRFYICSEEVKHYVAMLVEAKKLFTPSELTKVTTNNTCQTKLSDLGVL